MKKIEPSVFVFGKDTEVEWCGFNFFKLRFKGEKRAISIRIDTKEVDIPETSGSSWNQLKAQELVEKGLLDSKFV